MSNKNIVKSSTGKTSKDTIDNSKQESIQDIEEKVAGNTNINHIADIQPDTDESVKDAVTHAEEIENENIINEKQQTKQDIFFNFNQESDEEPPARANSLSLTLDDVSSTDTTTNITSVTCIIIFLCLLVILIMIAIGVGIKIGFMPSDNLHANDANYPECDQKLFEKDVYPKISIPLSQRIKQDIEEGEVTSNDDEQYLISIHNQPIQDILQANQDSENYEMFLIFGAIKRRMYSTFA